MKKKIEETIIFRAVRIAIVTVSDTRTLGNDSSGELLVKRLSSAGHELAHRSIIKDDSEAIVKLLESLVVNASVDVIITTGGTGLTGRDVTPEAFDRVCEKRIEGFGEMFRMLSFQKIGTSALQSRATAGLAGGTYMFALPGSPNACRDAWDEILIHQLDIRHRPCNFVELMPRLNEHLSK